LEKIKLFLYLGHSDVPSPQYALIGWTKWLTHVDLSA